MMGQIINDVLGFGHRTVDLQNNIFTCIQYFYIYKPNLHYRTHRFNSSTKFSVHLSPKISPTPIDFFSRFVASPSPSSRRWNKAEVSVLGTTSKRTGIQQFTKWFCSIGANGQVGYPQTAFLECERSQVSCAKCHVNIESFEENLHLSVGFFLCLYWWTCGLSRLYLYLDAQKLTMVKTLIHLNSKHIIFRHQLSQRVF